MKKNAILTAVTLLIFAAEANVSAQVLLTGNHYTQTFNAIASGLPVGWSVMTNGSATNLGTAALFVTNTASWSASAGQFANFASTTNNDGTPFAGTETAVVQAAATNRCLAGRLTGSFGDPGAAFVVQLQNTLGFANFQLSLDINMLSVQTRSNLWTIDYGFGANPAVFVPAGNYTDPGFFGTTNKTFSFGGALDNHSQPVWIRIVTLSTSSGTGSRDTVGIDNFKLTYSSLSPVPLDIQLVETNTVLTWTNPSFLLQAAPEVTGPFTNVPGATSPYTNPIAAPTMYFRLKAN